MTRKLSRAAITTASVILAACGLGACGGRYAVGYTAYDPYYYDYHPWVGPEPGYYNDWLLYSHRPHVEYRRLHRDEQRQYWQWRHTNHPEPAGRPGRDAGRR